MLFLEKIKALMNKTGSRDIEPPNPNLKPFLTNTLGLVPNNYEYYERAFIHRSAQIKSNKGEDINFERLEFIGDAVLGLIIATYLYKNAPSEQEGYLTKMRSKLVSRSRLNSIGKQLGLLNVLHPASNPNLGDDINGNLVEALIGAIYLDKGYKFTENLILKKVIADNVDLKKLERSVSSYKSLILEWAQKKKNKLDFNTFEEKNEDDLIIFVSVVRLNDKIISKGRGTSKKKAEESASRRAYYSLQKEIEKLV